MEKHPIHVELSLKELMNGETKTTPEECDEHHPEFRGNFWNYLFAGGVPLLIRQ
jgi:hypothetical protein